MTTLKNPMLYKGLDRNDEEECSSVHNFVNDNTSSARDDRRMPEKQQNVPLIHKVAGVWGIIIAVSCVAIMSIVANINNEIIDSDWGTKVIYPTSDSFRVDSLDCISCDALNPFQLLQDAQKNRIYTRVSTTLINSDKVVLLIDQLTSGVGIRELYWDAGTIISNDMVTFRKVGEKLLLTAVQTSYRGSADLMKRSFPSAVLHAFDVLHSNSSGDLVDVTDFLLLPIGMAHNNDLSNTIASNFGTQYLYQVDTTRSVLHPTTCAANAYRALFDRSITYSLPHLQPPARLGKSISVSARKILLLPDDYAASVWSSDSSFESRPYHPMSGFNSVSYMNESSPLMQPRQELLTVRHRLTQQSASTSMASPAVETQSSDRQVRDASSKNTAADTGYSQIVYYVDGDAPAGIREALVEGISWWDQAFQQAGYPAGTFVVQTIARGAFDPYDLHSPRLHFVEWVDRDLRAYSLGIRIEDPRSGEILKGHVRIENLRMRQDALLAEALLGPFQDDLVDGMGLSEEQGMSFADRLQARLLASQSENIKMGTSFRANSTHFHDVVSSQSQVVDDIMGAILQRVKQLGAHEVGHTLGLTHNFAGSSTVHGYASVMDYPPPIVTIDPTGTKLILNSNSYADGIGYFDKVAIDYGYRTLDPSLSAQAQREQLDDLLQQAERQGYVFLTDQDSGVSSGDWRDSPWDSGTDPVVALQTALQVRALAMQKLESSTVLSEFVPRSHLQELFPVVYLWHRYQVETAVKLLGGNLFQYALKRDTQLRSLVPIEGGKQLGALDQLIAALDPKSLAIPAALADLLLPNAFGYTPDIGGSADLLTTRSGSGTFDATVTLEIGANLVVSAIFSAPRLERLAVQAQLNTTLPSLNEVFLRLTSALFTVKVTDLVGGPCDPQGGGELLALMAAQSVLANAYMGVMDASSGSSTAHSLLVRNICKYHVQTVLLPAIDSIAEDLSKLPTGGELCVNNQVLLNAHISGLAAVVNAGKPFMTLSAPPVGPPI